MKKAGYCECFPELGDKELDEKYALISHAIQLGNRPEAKKYIEILKKNGININSYPKKKKFNEINDIVLGTNRTKFTFIDLFAGIGGFRIAMQSVGGQCVFSSEWDEAAKETYFDNYGEIPLCI